MHAHKPLCTQKGEVFLPFLLLLLRSCAANTTVLLDVSAALYALVLEGNLLFDDTAQEELHLQVGQTGTLGSSSSL